MALVSSIFLFAMRGDFSNTEWGGERKRGKEKRSRTRKRKGAAIRRVEQI
jgi:hypothetical protein